MSRRIIHLGPLAIEFEPDGQDPGVGMLRVTIAGEIMETPDIPTAVWLRVEHAADSVLRRATER